MQRSFLQGLVLGRSMKGVSFHRSAPGPFGMEGLHVAVCRMGEFLLVGRAAALGALSSREVFMGAYTTYSLVSAQ